jgi:hypothetical protein
MVIRELCERHTLGRLGLLTRSVDGQYKTGERQHEGDGQQGSRVRGPPYPGGHSDSAFRLRGQTQGLRNNLEPCLGLMPDIGTPQTECAGVLKYAGSWGTRLVGVEVSLTNSHWVPCNRWNSCSRRIARSAKESKPAIRSATPLATDSSTLVESKSSRNPESDRESAAGSLRAADPPAPAWRTNLAIRDSRQKKGPLTERLPVEAAAQRTESTVRSERP